MNAGDLSKKIAVILEEIKRLDAENPTGPDEEADPRIVKLIEEGEQIMRRLNPLVRAKMWLKPAALAEWDEIMHSCDDLKEAGPERSGDSQAH